MPYLRLLQYGSRFVWSYLASSHCSRLAAAIVSGTAKFGIRGSRQLHARYELSRHPAANGLIGSPGGNLDRSLSWTGDIVNSIVDNDNPGTTPPFSYGAQSQSFTYTPARRLATASGYYGALSFTC